MLREKDTAVAMEAAMPIGPDNTAYSVTARQDGTYAVQIIKPSKVPYFKEGFKSEVEADDWIFDQIERTSAKSPPYAGPPDSLPGHAPGTEEGED